MAKHLYNALFYRHDNRYANKGVINFSQTNQVSIFWINIWLLFELNLNFLKQKYLITECLKIDCRIQRTSSSQAVEVV